jgi:uncharacterized tellurite resistance protein B-like protein
MDTNFSEFTVAQRQALLDLLVLTMYADGHLASNEDALIERLLTDLGYATPYDRQREFDASVTRVRQYTEHPEAARVYATTLARGFTRDQGRKIYGFLEYIVTSDSHITAFESELLEALRDIFRM